MHRDLSLQQQPTRPEGAFDNNETAEVEDGDDDDDDDVDEGLLFFPTGFSRPKPRTYYRGSDPEWQEFVRLSNDKSRIEKIRSSLVVMVREMCSKSPAYVQRLGKIDPNLGGVWLEVRFPDGPPIEFERPGFELTEDFTFRKATRPIHELHHQQISRVLVPTAVGISLYLDTKRRLQGSWQDLKAYLGWENGTKPMSAQNMIKDAIASPPPPSNASATTGSAPTAAVPSTRPDSSSKRTTSTPPSSQSGNPALERLGVSLPDPTKTPIMDMTRFHLDLRKNRKPYSVQPPRGTFVVSGWVEILGERARATIEISAVYDPKTAGYVAMQARLRSLQNHKQIPKGGP